MVRTSKLSSQQKIDPFGIAKLRKEDKEQEKAEKSWLAHEAWFQDIREECLQRREAEERRKAEVARLRFRSEGVYEVTWAGGLAVFDELDPLKRKEATRGRWRQGMLAEGSQFEVCAFDGMWGKIGGAHPHRDRWIQLGDGKQSAQVECAKRVGDLPEPLLLTVHAGDLSPEGLVDVVTTNIGGEEVASLQANLGESVQSLQDAIQRELQEDVQHILLMLPDGSVLHDAHTRLSDVLQGRAPA